MIDKLLEAALIATLCAMVGLSAVVIAATGWGTLQTVFAPRRVCLEAQSEQVWVELPRGSLEPATRVTCLRWEGRP